MDYIEANFDVSEKNRSAFLSAKIIGRTVATGAILFAGFTALSSVAPLWVLVAVGSSITIANVIGAAMDYDERRVDDKSLEKNLQKSGDFFVEGLSRGFIRPFQTLAFSVLGTPFWPALLVIGPLVNKGTAGYYFFRPKSTGQGAFPGIEEKGNPYRLDETLSNDFNGAGNSGNDKKMENTPSPSTAPKPKL